MKSFSNIELDAFFGKNLSVYQPMATTLDSPNFRALCAELLAAIQLYTGQNPAASEMSSVEKTEKLMDAMAATVAALATPPPEAPIDVTLEPSFSQRQQLLQGLSRYCFCHTSAHRYLKVWIRDYARAALERWGQR